MLPTLCPGDSVLATSLLVRILPPKKGELIVIAHPIEKTPLIKRIEKVANGSFFVRGDNESKSTDSRNFGWITIEDILGKVLYTIS